MLIDLVSWFPGAFEPRRTSRRYESTLLAAGAALSVSIGGNRPNANYFSPRRHDQYRPTFNTSTSAVSDAVQEFKVQTGSYSAEMGGAGGGKSYRHALGRQRLSRHGVRLLRNGAMDAIPSGRWFFKFLVQNNFGGSFGGPIAITKTFFFLTTKASAIRRRFDDGNRSQPDEIAAFPDERRQHLQSRSALRLRASPPAHHPRAAFRTTIPSQNINLAPSSSC